MKKIDDTNKEIIKKLLDGRKAFSAIADELDITENTVRSRVNKMVDEGILKISGLVDPTLIPGLQISQIIRILIITRTARLHSVG